MEQKYIGVFPNGYWQYTGTRAEIQAVNGPEGSVGLASDSPYILRFENGTWGNVGAGQVGADGNVGFPGPVVVPALGDNPSIANMVPGAMVQSSEGGLIYCHPSGQKIFDGNKICVANIAEVSAFTSTNESAFIAQQTAASGYNIDGKWNRVSKHRIPPVIRAGFLSRKSEWLHSHIMLGGNFSTTPTGKILTIREYWVKPDDTLVKMLEIPIDGANLPAWTSGSNRPIHVFADYNYNDTVAGSLSAAKIRVHWRAFVGKFSSGQFWDAGESFFVSDYPIVDLTVEQRIRWTAQWNVSGGTLYSDQFEYHT